MEEKDLVLIIKLKKKAAKEGNYLLAQSLKDAQHELESCLHSMWNAEILANAQP